MPITIKNADGTTRSTNWPPANKPVMLDDLRDEARAASQAEYDAIKAADKYDSYSYRRSHIAGKLIRINNDTGDVETIDA